MLTDRDTDPLAAIRGEFDRHRATHRRGRFPERLWRHAVEFARTASSTWYGDSASMSTAFAVA